MATGFYAYTTSASPLVAAAISTAIEAVKPRHLKITPWESMNPLGFKVDDLIREKIDQADVLIADITTPNHNVFYEIGFAVGRGKPVLPTLNVSIEKALLRVQSYGLFDTIGWATYSNGVELAERIQQWKTTAWSNHYIKPKDHIQPLFVLDTEAKTDFRNQIFSAVESSQVNFRSFDPSETPRLAANRAISDISASSGVILPIIGTDVVGQALHNNRASFLLGLCHGLNVEALAIQYGNAPAPLDYRDFITNSTFKRETEKAVSEFCNKTLVWNQRATDRARLSSVGVLGDIDLGSPVAESETQKLNYYFIKTAEFSRALRAEGAVVVGRKGSGKTAIFLQIAEELSRDRRKCIVDIRPASHNLSELREALLGVASEGVFDHTIAAFWQYILFVEMVLKVREIALPKSKNDFSLQNRIRKLEEDFSLSEEVVAGDFTSRLETAVRDVVRVSKSVKTAGDLRAQLTNMMFERPIPKLREAVVSFSDFFDEIVFLIDDLDKGWPPRRVEAHDVSTIKHLIEGLNKIQRDLSKKSIDLSHLVFLRSDIYEQLVERTSDRGKYNLIKVDWSDPEQLRNLLYKRITNKFEEGQIEDAWASCNPKIDGSTAVDLMIEGSLRRPRFLIDLCERVLSFAINRGHPIVTEDDVEDGLKQMSLYLVSDFGFEMRDVAGTPEGIFYKFIGQPDSLTENKIGEILNEDELGIGLKATIDLLLWYGFLGISRSDGPPLFVYDRAYDFRRLEAELPTDRSEVVYAVNPAFLRGLVAS